MEYKPAIAARWPGTYRRMVDEVRMDVVPIVSGAGKRYFGSVHGQHLLENPDEVVQGNRVLHIRYRRRR